MASSLSGSLAKARIATVYDSGASITARRDISFDYLRAFLIVLVLLQHVASGYSLAHSVTPLQVLVPAVPVVHPVSSAFADMYLAFSRFFLMPLLFLISGLFVWPSVSRKGVRLYIRDRVIRLGVPFIFFLIVCSPLAYVPPYLLTGGDPSVSAYAHTWFSLTVWPSGPSWFLWVLFAFDLLVVGAYVIRRVWRRAASVCVARLVAHDPDVLMGLFIAITALAYIPMQMMFDPDLWVSFGPFAVQISRVSLYACYFVAGVALGVIVQRTDARSLQELFVRRWPLWVALSFAAYVLRVEIIKLFTGASPYPGHMLPVDWLQLRALSEILLCAVMSFAFISVFKRFVVSRMPLLDSLSANSYSMYLVHYPIVIWLQYAVLRVDLEPVVKVVIVFAAALVSSWVISIGLRRIPFISKIISL